MVSFGSTHVFGPAGSSSRPSPPNIYTPGLGQGPAKSRAYALKTRMDGHSLARILQSGAGPTDCLRRFLSTRTEIAAGKRVLLACDRVVTVVGSRRQNTGEAQPSRVIHPIQRRSHRGNREARTYARRAGSETIISVPFAGADRQAKAAPIFFARSAIPRSPQCPSVAAVKTSSALKPLPLSRHDSLNVRVPYSSSLVIRDAWACRNEFVIASRAIEKISSTTWFSSRSVPPRLSTTHWTVPSPFRSLAKHSSDGISSASVR